MEIIAIFFIVCAVCRCVMFKKRDAHWWQGIIPAYCIYKLGKLCGTKKLGLVNAIVQSVLFIFFFFCFGFELYLISEYTMNVDAETFSYAYVVVPENIAHIAIALKYILVVLAAIAFGFWCMMMWQFIKVHRKSAWWILLWAIIPVIPYVVFAISNDVYIDGCLYTSKRVLSEIDKQLPKKVKKK